MEYNKKKKRVVAFVISFFYLMLLSMFIFEDQYFHGGFLFSTYLF